MNERDAVLKAAFDEIGYCEKASAKDLDAKIANAGRNNYTKYARDLDAIPGFFNGSKQGAAWCAVFVCACFVYALGVDRARELLCLPKNSLAAGCEYARKYFAQRGQLFSNPKIGDQVFFKTAGKSTAQHTGIVYDVDATSFYTIEGNTSNADGVIPNGGEVAFKRYDLGYVHAIGFGRPLYAGGSTVSVLEWQKAAIADGFRFPKYGADGEWGAECEGVAKKAVVKKQLLGYKYPALTRIVQRVVGVKVDGKCGKDTAAAIKTWQKAHGLTADGAVGVNSWKKILGK